MWVLLGGLILSYSKHEKDIFNSRLDKIIADSNLRVGYAEVKGYDE